MISTVGLRSKSPGFNSRSWNLLSSKHTSSKHNPYWWLRHVQQEPNWQSPQPSLDISPESSAALELHSRAAPSVGAHRRLSGPTRGRNSGGRRIIKKGRKILSLPAVNRICCLFVCLCFCWCFFCSSIKWKHPSYNVKILTLEDLTEWMNDS